MRSATARNGVISTAFARRDASSIRHLLKNSKEALEVLDSLPDQVEREIRNKNIAYARIYYDLEDYVYIHPQNVLVIDENFKCYDKTGAELVEVDEIPRIETVSAKDL